ncbi:MAG: hypothetical protein IPM29_09300 [Planctomycetes bacterium]|nr:hypothetical protein [Planctomycetota bacterium]
MNFRFPVLTVATLAAAFAAFAPQASAQTVNRYGYYSLQLGNEWAGGSVYAGASLQAIRSARSTIAALTNDTGYALLTADAQVRYLKQTSRLVYAFVSARSATGTNPYDGRFQLDVRGVIERNQRFTTSGTSTLLSYYRTFDLFPTDLTASTSVAGVPVSLHGNVGVGVQAYGSMSMTGPGRASLGGLARAWGYGRLRAQAGWSWAGAGADLTATFADTRLSPSVYADARNPLFSGGPTSPTVGGRIPLTINPISLRIDVWVALILRYTHNLVNWSAPTITLADLLF